MILGSEVVFPLLAAFLISVAICPVVIPFLQRLKIGQTEREDGVQSHLQKAGTPTMGGLIFLISILVTSLFFVKEYPNIIPILWLTLGFGIVGFLDDYLKVVLKSTDGLKPMQKMAGQFIVTTGFLVYILVVNESFLEVLIPFSGGQYLACKWLMIPVFYVAALGTVNGVNFTDGLDGLATSVTAVVAAFFTIVSVLLAGGIQPITAIVTGALLGFLLFNVHPAKVFMGDTGSLALGGFVVGSAYMLRMPWIIIIVGCVYLIEVLSVIIQVTYFKKTGGKRIFKMAPIHHHFELCGWSETRVVAVFTVITILLCAVGMLILS